MIVNLAAWLRTNAERYLMIAAEAEIAKKYARRGPSRPKGLGAMFFMVIFVPVYRAIPWKIRSKMITAMPGSHRQSWNPRDRHTSKPAI